EFDHEVVAARRNATKFEIARDIGKGDVDNLRLCLFETHFDPLRDTGLLQNFSANGKNRWREIWPVLYLQGTGESRNPGQSRNQRNENQDFLEHGLHSLRLVVILGG